MKRQLQLIFLFIGTFLATACGWQEVRQVHDAVFSDDGTEQAYVISIVDERRDFRFEHFRQRKNQRHQLFVVHPDGSNERSFTDVRTASAGFSFYYMKSAGYLQLEVIEDHGDTTSRRIDILNLDGQLRGSIQIPEDPQTSCTGHTAVPSPDGSLIALVYRQGSPSEEESGCSGAPVIVTFFNSINVSEVASHTWNSTGDWTPVVTWTSDGKLIVRVGAELETTKTIDPNLGPQPSDYSACYYPKSTSSAISASGVRIRVGDVDGDPIVEIPLGDLAPFGTCTQGLDENRPKPLPR